MMRLAAKDGVGIVAVVGDVVAVCISCTGADNNLRVDDDDE